MSLREYQRKRDFSKTAEPPPEKGRGAGGALFVIQKHAATRLHFDFRLEMGGVLKSWAVPKGIPMEKGKKRLAVEVEDHPLDYARFEGVIPEGEYGGGTVMVWDIGEYTVSGDDPQRAWKAGKLHLGLAGGKLKGEWTLVRTRGAGKGEARQWLLMKTGEEARPIGARRAERSALSGRTMRQIAQARDAEWRSNRSAARELAARFIEPMKPRLVRTLPAGKGWLYELKLDGYRVIAVKQGRQVALFSRNAKAFDFPELSAAVAALPCRSAVLDGEVVALDEKGRASFQLLQGRMMGEPAVIRYYLFDLLELDGKRLLSEPLARRKERLEELIGQGAEPLRFSANLPGSGEAVLEAVNAMKLEGLVAKRAESRYAPGVRSPDWAKFKCVNEQELVIGGYTAPQGSRHGFGALALGYFEGGKLRFAGKVGTGFTEKSLKEIHRRLQPLRREACPFSDLPSRSAGRWNQGITPAEMKRCTWVEPLEVAQIRFGEWTRDGKVRQAVFLGLREDKPAEEVGREG